MKHTDCIAYLLTQIYTNFAKKYILTWHLFLVYTFVIGNIVTKLGPHIFLWHKFANKTLKKISFDCEITSFTKKNRTLKVKGTNRIDINLALKVHTFWEGLLTHKKLIIYLMLFVNFKKVRIFFSNFCGLLWTCELYILNL